MFLEDMKLVFIRYINFTGITVCPDAIYLTDWGKRGYGFFFDVLLSLIGSSHVCLEDKYLRYLLKDLFFQSYIYVLL